MALAEQKSDIDTESTAIRHDIDRLAAMDSIDAHIYLVKIWDEDFFCLSLSRALEFPFQ